jgi:hypothetical protein
VHRRIWRIAEVTVDHALATLSAQESAQLMKLLGRVKKSLVAEVDGVTATGRAAAVAVSKRSLAGARTNGSAAP